jgi:hypothetical protein
MRITQGRMDGKVGGDDRLILERRLIEPLLRFWERTGAPRSPGFPVRGLNSVCGFLQGKPHEVRQRQRASREIRVASAYVGRIRLCSNAFTQSTEY